GFGFWREQTRPVQSIGRHLFSTLVEKPPPFIHDGSFPRSPEASKSHSPRKKLPKSALLLYKSAGQLDPVEKLASGGCDSTVKVWKLYNGNWKMGLLGTQLGDSKIFHCQCFTGCDNHGYGQWHGIFVGCIFIHQIFDV
ncbi:unnamed protein product, partial [Musa hybrid cultivar]